MSELPAPRFLDERVAHWAATTPDAEAVTYLQRSWTWAQWDDRVRRLAGALAARGVGRGGVVAFLDKNHPACVEATLAAASLGAANAIINFRLAAEELDYVINDSGATVLFVGAELRPAVEAIRDRLPAVTELIEVKPDGADAYEEMLAVASPVGRSPEVAPDDVCIIMYSSGTTGRPKGVALTQANVIAHTVNAFDGWTAEPGDKNLVAMPLFHVGGTSYMQYGLQNGVPSYMTRDVDGAALAGGIVAGANRTFLVPAVLAKVLDTGADAVKLFGALKTYAYGASPMPLPLLRRALQAWPDTEFIQVYGLTEVCGVVTRLMPEDHRSGNEERLVSAGTLIPEAQLRVADPNTGEEVPTGEQGELWFRTPQLMKGYLNKPEATAEAVTPDGWFRTGDIGRVDADGYVFVEDRLKDMIISGGENIYSIEVERVLAEHPAVAEVAVFGVPDEKWGEAVKAVVALDGDAGGDVSADELIAWARERLAAYKCPKTVDFTDALPRNPTGKIMKKDLRKAHWEGRDRATV
ncbi:long-chain-fatty-acid--CoA ligase [Mycolicibacterium sp. 120266]|uniref:long-chain-fatty-acid--CoA ligase n=1 Tax=Mycolicibacterium sp. 120266 TaxID=3090601 RepID=UPI00299E6A84|nr:long-chain-fatty-acid--CoA ligase [Mycolicibacterium sp. 120266]MDX1871574.1 long-chain-fatty-acid--CoA ligase [Mycolicibacterium sp. 120266]